MRSGRLLFLLLFVIACSGCIVWKGDRPQYWQRVLDPPTSVRRLPRPDDRVDMQVMIGNPFNVPIRLLVHCNDWSWGDEEIRMFDVKPHSEFSALSETTVDHEYMNACRVIAWKRLP